MSMMELFDEMKASYTYQDVFSLYF